MVVWDCRILHIEITGPYNYDKSKNLTMDLLSLSIFGPGPKFSPTDPKFCGEFKFELCS